MSILLNSATLFNLLFSVLNCSLKIYPISLTLNITYLHNNLSIYIVVIFWKLNIFAICLYLCVRTNLINCMWIETRSVFILGLDCWRVLLALRLIVGNRFPHNPFLEFENMFYFVYQVKATPAQKISLCFFSVIQGRNPVSFIFWLIFCYFNLNIQLIKMVLQLH